MADGIQVKGLSQSILKTLLYYDLFMYPLTSSEVFQYLSTNHVTEEDVDQGLHQLVAQSVIYRFGRFFSIQNNSGLESRRATGNKLAMESLKLARQKSKLIAGFPFVRGVFISGSLAKGYMDENSDLDFFIITSPGRLWIARTLLVLYKRIFLLNSHKHFCVNYFVDAAHLEIEEKNLFTATELATLIPMQNPDLYLELLKNNPWIKTFFPNYQPRSTGETGQISTKGVKAGAERIINLFFAPWLERLFKAATLRRWVKHYGQQYPQADFRIAFKTKDYVSKNHPRNYQRKVMELYERKLGDFASANRLTWVR